MPSALDLAVAELPAATTEMLRIPTANAVNFHEAMSPDGPAKRLDIDALLALPATDGPHATVVIVPGSAGVSANHVMHAATLVGEGYAVCLVDPFGARAVESTVANQTQYSFASSAYDVTATLAVLAADPRIDPARISAQGHSRGGAAVMIAAMRRFAQPSVGDLAFAGVLGAYPWCGQQFLHPDVGGTAVRAIIGDQDDWCSVMAVQAQIQAIALTGGDATMRVVPGAHHSFDRHQDVLTIPEARVSPNAPIEFLADDGSMIDPTTGVADPARTDMHQFRDAMKAGFGQQGATMGSKGDQPAVFVAEMLAFHRRVLGDPSTIRSN
jgi:dienelactone hydrolase